MLADAFGPNICVWVSEIQGNICVDKQRAPHDFLTNGGRARAWLIYQAPSFVELSAIQQANHIHTHQLAWLNRVRMTNELFGVDDGTNHFSIHFTHCQLERDTLAV